MHLDGDSIWIRANTLCSTGDKLCSLIGRYSLTQNEFADIKHFDEIQGGRSLLVFPDKLFLSSEESTLNNNISLSQVKKSNLDFINTIDLKIADSRYFSYTIKKSIIYQDRFVVGAQALDSMKYINYQGWYNYQENAVFFVLNSELQLDTILIIPPSSGAFLKIEDLAVGPDSILYISFYEKYLKAGSSQDYLEIRKVIYGFNKTYNLVFQWIGPDFDNQESLSCLAISTDTTIYMNYNHDYRTYLMALKPDGSLKWECLLDSTIGWNLYSIRSIIIAENGDIVGTGVISSVVDELGESGFLFRVDNKGNLLWKRAIRVNKGFDKTVPEIFPFQTGLEDLLELPNGDLIATGYVRKYVGDNIPDGPYDFDIWMVRTSAEGCLWDDCPYIQDIVSKSNYIPVVTPENEWVVDVNVFSIPTLIYRYTFSDDSVLVDGEYFRELLYATNMTAPWKNSGEYFREENGKVFKFGGLIGPTKKLLYDFDFSIGDTLAPHNDGFPNHREIVQVGGIRLLDGIQRKFLTLQCTTDIILDSTMWIEGMGDIESLFWTESFCSAIDGDGASIRCFTTNGQLLYLRPDLEGCYTTSVDNLESGSLKVYPNPSYGILHFDINNEQPIERILMYDSVGKMVLTASKLLTEDDLDVSNLASGFYIGIIHFRDNSFRTFKIVVEK